MRWRTIIGQVRRNRNLQIPFLINPYKYEPLSSPTSIRLLELAPCPDKGIIRCSLTAFELDEAPPFRALSYTWGPSHVDLHAPSKEPFPKHPIAHAVTHSSSHPNEPSSSRRHTIICDGRSIKVTTNLRDALRMLASKITLPKLPSAPSYYWIDALCMDQENVHEKNDQVARMADVFARSAGIVVWLGMEDEFTKDALQTMRTISSIPESSWSEVPYTAFYQPEKGQNAPWSGLSFYNWLGFIVLINRAWFKRAWVVQEIGFAKSAVVVCGNKTFDWDILSKTLSFIKETKWYHHLHTEKLRQDKILRRNPGIYKRVLQSSLSVGIAPIYINETRLSTSSSNESKERGIIQPPPLRMLLDKHRFSKSTDPRDKVYAFLGLADRTMAPFRTQPAALTPNYNLSVQQVYTETARVLLATYKNLSLLSHVEDPTLRRIQGLPSWVPDFSVSLDPYPLRFRGPSYWKASGDRGWRLNEGSMAEGLLDVQGYFLDYVDSTALLLDETKDPSAFWASIVKLALSLNLPYPFTSKGSTAPSRVEVLWRTLTTDIYAHIHPAPPEVGQLFLDYILNLQVRHRLTPWSATDAFQPQHSPLSDSIYPEWRTLLNLEPAGSPYGFDRYKKRLTAVVESMFDGTYSPIELAQLQHELDQSGGKKRRLFKTQTGLMGTGPRSLRPGDEIWILLRGGLPLVLRPHTSGNYRLIGESFVYGIMHGEALASLTSPLQKITIE